MSLQIGIVGLPNAGKSTLFNALIGQAAAAAENFPFTTIDPNVGVVDLPDERLTKLANLVHPEKVVPATVQFVDIAGIVKGASQGEGLGNKFLAHIREVNAIAVVVRAFEDPNVIHVAGTVDSASDLGVILTELMLADLESVERQRGPLEGKARSGDKDATAMLAVLDKLEQNLKAERVPKLNEFTDDERKLVKRANLLTTKPFIVTPNVAETEMTEWTPLRSASGASEGQATLRRTVDQTLGSDTPIVPISAKIESELRELSPDEQRGYLAALGVEGSGLVRLIQIAFATLGLATYFTAGTKEVRAWTIHRGDTAPQAAGVIHGDFVRGFIAAETVGYEQFVADGGWAGAKAAGHIRTEGKTYVVRDGDVLLFRFNV